MAVSAAAFVLAFPPYDLGALAWAALIPLVAVVCRRPARRAFWTGYAWGVLAFGGVLWWLTSFGVLLWALAACLAALAPAAALAAAAWAGAGNPRRTALWMPVTWTAVEYLRGRGPFGMPWALLGDTQHAALAVSQIAAVTGVYGLTFLVALVNTAGALVLARAADAATVAGTAAAVAAAVLYGSAALRTPVRADVTVAVVQPAYPVRMAWNPAQAARDLAQLDVLTHDAAAPSAPGDRAASLVVWPETASPVDIAGDPGMRASVAEWARRDRAALIVTSLESGSGGEPTNSAFALARDGVMIGRYDKHRLVPFAEAGERPGRGPAVLPTPVGALGVAICFESIFPDHARAAVLDGAALLAVLTNDAWFDGRAAPLQHAAVAPLRAIEDGRFLLRASNAGPSAIIDPHGRIVAELPLGVRGVLKGRVAPRTDLTWYARYGDVVAWASVVASAAALAPGAARLAVGDGRGPAFGRLLAASAVPLAALFAIAPALHALAGTPAGWAPAPLGVSVPLPPLAVLVATALLSRRRAGSAAGFGRGFMPAAAASLAIVAAMVAIALRAFTAHGGATPITAPAGGWWAGTAVQVLVVGLGLEWWLRGLVFAAAAEWRGAGWAVGWSAVLGAIAGSARGPEAGLWGLVAGAAFGLVRTRWAQVPALALAHGIGSAVLGFAFAPW
ncbi:MAG TPA: apolipoprotein N-acyltransferase [bacterium]|nr:apolipoprotein N-acyltransferase [bacterium]